MASGSPTVLFNCGRRKECVRPKWAELGARFMPLRNGSHILQRLRIWKSLKLIGYAFSCHIIRMLVKAFANNPAERNFE